MTNEFSWRTYVNFGFKMIEYIAFHPTRFEKATSPTTPTLPHSSPEIGKVQVIQVRPPEPQTWGA